MSYKNQNETKNSNKFEEKDIYKKLKALLEKSSPVHSNFKVAAVIVDDQNNIYAGCNIEEKGDITSGSCAERTAISHLIAARGSEARISQVYILGQAPDGQEVSASPCGKCREMIKSYALNDNIPVKTLGKNGIIEEWTLEQLLPSANNALNETDKAFNSPELNKEVNKKLNKGLEASYAPYSKEKSALAILGDNNKLYLGCNIENAAFPSGINALSSALSSMVIDGCQKIKSVYMRTVDEKGNDLNRFPSGNARQQLREFSNPEEVNIFILGKNNVLSSSKLDSLLVSSFGPSHLSGDNQTHKNTNIKEAQTLKALAAKTR